VSAAAVLLGISALTLAWSATLFLFIRPTPRSRRSIVAQYEPPRSVSVLAGASLTDDRRRSISAQLVDLAVRGHLSVLPPLTPSGEYLLRFEHAAGLDDVERAVVRAFFGHQPAQGAVVTPSRGDTRLLQRLRWAQFRADRVVESSGLRIRTRRRRGLLVLVQLGLFIALVPVGWPNLLIALVALAFLFVTVLLSSKRVDPLTAAGVEIRDHISGLRLYIGLAEAHRFRVLQTPDGALVRDDAVALTERLLGWAVLFGLEREWAKVLDTLRAAGGMSGEGGATDVAPILAFSAQFSDVATDGGLGGDPNDPNTPAGQADTGDGAGAGGSDSSSSDGGGGDGGGGGGD
jgi:uncharacterized membrane protein YgcG